MALAIIAVVLIVVGFPVAVLAAYAVEEHTGTDSPTGAPPTPTEASRPPAE
jgi:hypothetical protein